MALSSYDVKYLGTIAGGPVDRGSCEIEEQQYVERAPLHATMKNFHDRLTSSQPHRQESTSPATKDPIHSIEVVDGKGIRKYRKLANPCKSFAG